MRTQCKMDIHEPGSGPSPDIKFDSTLILSIPVSRTVRNKCSLFKLPIYGNLSTWAKTLFLAISLFLTWGQSLAGKKRWGWYLLPKVTKPHLTGGWTPLPLALTMPIWRQWTPSYTLWVPTLFFVFLNFLAMPRIMWDLGSLTRDWIHASCIGSRVLLNHWTAREVSPLCVLVKGE